MKHKVEFKLPGNFADAFCSLQRFGLEMLEEQEETRIIVLRVADIEALGGRPGGGNVPYRGLSRYHYWPISK